MKNNNYHTSRKEVLLVSIYDEFNHGNRLQDYALQESLKSIGYVVYNICATSSRLMPKLLKFIKLFAKVFLTVLRIRKSTIIKQAFLAPLRRKRFKVFTNTYINNRIYTTYEKVIYGDKNQWNIYYYAVAGSDQIWHNWSRTQEELKFFYLCFIPTTKRIAYAPSFGFSEFPEKDYETHLAGLRSFKSLSCREQDGCDLIKRTTGLNVKLVLDPTLLLNMEQWTDLEQKPFYDVPEHFVLVYMLGHKTDEYKRVIENTVSEKNQTVNHVMKVIDIFDYKQKSYYLTNPNEFIWLFRHADFICTDSFHGTVFSIIFEKHFIAFRRQPKEAMSMFGRIETLLSNLGLTERIYSEKNSYTDFVKSKIDYISVKTKLEAMKKDSLEYLQDCLKSE